MSYKNTEVNLVGDGQNDLLECGEVLGVSRKSIPWNVHIKALARAGAHLRVVASVAARIEEALIEPMQRNVKHSISAKKKQLVTKDVYSKDNTAQYCSSHPFELYESSKE